MAQEPIDFLAEFKAVMIYLETKLRRDPEAAWWLGSLAGELIRTGRRNTWAELKHSLPPAAQQQLLSDLEKQGNELVALGRDKPAYATHVLRLSILAGTQQNQAIRKGIPIFDNYVETAARLYRAKLRADAAPTAPTK